MEKCYDITCNDLLIIFGWTREIQLAFDVHDQVQQGSGLLRIVLVEIFGGQLHFIDVLNSVIFVADAFDEYLDNCEFDELVEE